MTAGLIAGGVTADARSADSVPSESDSYPFHSEHQSGIPDIGPGRQAGVLGRRRLDVVDGTSRADLVDLMKTLTTRACTSPQGGAPKSIPGCRHRPRIPTNVLGPQMFADGPTTTLGMGASLFDDRLGLASSKPVQPGPMRSPR